MMFIVITDPFEAVGVFAAIGTTLLMLYAGGVGIYWFQKRFVNRQVGGGSDLEELKERVGRLEEVEGRVADLEERLDFAERMLSQAQSQAALPPGERI